jgi:hypothetical protein
MHRSAPKSKAAAKRDASEEEQPQDDDIPKNWLFGPPEDDEFELQMAQRRAAQTALHLKSWGLLDSMRQLARPDARNPAYIDPYAVLYRDRTDPNTRTIKALMQPPSRYSILTEDLRAIVAETRKQSLFDWLEWLRTTHDLALRRILFDSRAYSPWRVAARFSPRDEPTIAVWVEFLPVVSAADAKRLYACAGAAGASDGILEAPEFYAVSDVQNTPAPLVTVHDMQCTVSWFSFSKASV